MENFKMHRIEFLLRQTEFIPVSHLAKEMKVSERQIHRYISDLKKRNVEVEIKRAGKDKNVNEPSYRIRSGNIIDSPGLTSVQFNQLMDMLDHYEEADKDLRSKLLFILSKARYAAFYLSDNEKKIQACIKEKVKLKIKAYHHRDGTISPLILNPVRLDAYNGRLYAYREHETLNDVNKYNLELMDLDENDYRGAPYDMFKDTGRKSFDPFKIEQDLFGFYAHATGKTFEVSLLLKPFAYSQLFRQFPHLMTHVKKLDPTENEYLYSLKLKVYDIQPIARFVTGLLNEIKIQGDDISKKAILSYIEKRVFDGLKNNDQDFYNQHIK